jgi:hypothetical protein
MSKFTFVTDEHSEEYCVEIAQAMANDFGISEDEAVSRINQHWSGLTIVGEEDMIYHELPHYWAWTVYYGHDSYWWISSPKREELNLMPLEPQCAPKSQ